MEKVLKEIKIELNLHLGILQITAEFRLSGR